MGLSQILVRALFNPVRIAITACRARAVLSSVLISHGFLKVMSLNSSKIMELAILLAYSAQMNSGNQKMAVENRDK